MRLDLPAREDVRADRVERVDVDDERQLLDQRAVAAGDLVRGQVVVIALAESDGAADTITESVTWGARLPRTGYRTR